jgi:hypothetical protein
MKFLKNLTGKNRMKSLIHFIILAACANEPAPIQEYKPPFVEQGATYLTWKLGVPGQEKKEVDDLLKVKWFVTDVANDHCAGPNEADACFRSTSDRNFVIQTNVKDDCDVILHEIVHWFKVLNGGDGGEDDHKDVEAFSWGQCYCLEVSGVACPLADAPVFEK